MSNKQKNRPEAVVMLYPTAGCVEDLEELSRAVLRLSHSFHIIAVVTEEPQVFQERKSLNAFAKRYDALSKFLSARLKVMEYRVRGGISITECLRKKSRLWPRLCSEMGLLQGERPWQLPVAVPPEELRVYQQDYPECRELPGVTVDWLYEAPIREGTVFQLCQPPETLPDREEFRQLPIDGGLVQLKAGWTPLKKKCEMSSFVYGAEDEYLVFKSAKSSIGKRGKRDCYGVNYVSKLRRLQMLEGVLGPEIPNVLPRFLLYDENAARSGRTVVRGFAMNHWKWCSGQEAMRVESLESVSSEKKLRNKVDAPKIRKLYIRMLRNLVGEVELYHKLGIFLSDIKLDNFCTLLPTLEVVAIDMDGTSVFGSDCFWPGEFYYPEGENPRQKRTPHLQNGTLEDYSLTTLICELLMDGSKLHAGNIDEVDQDPKSDQNEYTKKLQRERRERWRRLPKALRKEIEDFFHQKSYLTPEMWGCLLNQYLDADAQDGADISGLEIQIEKRKPSTALRIIGLIPPVGPVIDTNSYYLFVLDEHER